MGARPGGVKACRVGRGARHGAYNRPMGDDLNPFSAVPLFPLPNVVLFPRAVLPLHVFEERYKLMTADALRGDRQVAMGLLLPGWERDYHHKPAIEPVVCIGTILTHERLPDGKYNFLLQGHTRARVVREVGATGKPYRLATLEPIAEPQLADSDLHGERRRLATMFEQGRLAALPTATQFREILAGPLPTSDVADLVAFNLLDDVPLKQSLLADGDVRRRIARTIEAVAGLHPPVASSYLRVSNPSTN
jgi:Lon protease-like protein